MSHTIVIGVDGSDHADAALRWGGALGRTLRARVIVAAAAVHAPPLRGDSSAYEALERHDAEEVAGRARKSLEGITDVQEVVVTAATPTEGLHLAAEDKHADLLVLGTSERMHVAGQQPGSVPEHVLHHSPCPVAVVPPFTGQPAFARVGVAVDDGAPAALAFEFARTLATELGGEGVELRLLHVAPADTAFLRPGVPAPAPERHITPAWLEELAARAGDGVAVEIVEDVGDPSKRLVELAGGLDLLVTGSRDQGRLRRMLLGSTSAHLVRHAVCPVIVVPGGEATAETAPAGTAGAGAEAPPASGA